MRPIEFEKIRERYLPECTTNTKAQHHKSIYALRAAAMIRAGVDPGLLDEVSWWRTDDLWVWALDALLVYLRVAADRTGEPIGVVCKQVAKRHGVALTTPESSETVVQRPCALTSVAGRRPCPLRVLSTAKPGSMAVTRGQCKLPLTCTNV